MANATESFARGVQLQDNLMSRIVARNREKQQMEQSAALLPLRMQGLENENEMGRLNLITQGYKNQLDEAKISDQVIMTEGMSMLAMGQDPGELSFRTPEASAAWMNAKAHSALGQRRAQLSASFMQRLANPAIRGEDVSSIMEELDKNPTGEPSAVAWRKLTTVEGIAEDQVRVEKADELAKKAALDNQFRLEQIQLRNEGNLDVAQERVKKTIFDSQGIDPIRKATFLNKARVIRDDVTKSSAAKQAALDDLMLDFIKPVDGSAPTAVISPEVRMQSEAYDLQIGNLLKSKIEREAKGKDTAEIDQTINALKAAKKKASGKMVVHSDGTITGFPTDPVGSGESGTTQTVTTPPAAPERKYTLEDIAAAFGLSDRPAPQAPLPNEPAKGPQRSGMADVLADGLKLQQRRATDPAALKFWETVKKRLGVLPHTHTK